MRTGLFDTTETYELMCRDFVPLVDQHCSKRREEIQTLEKALESAVSLQEKQFSEVFKFIQGAALLWDSHRTDTDQICRTYQVSLTWIHYAILNSPGTLITLSILSSLMHQQRNLVKKL